MTRVGQEEEVWLDIISEPFFNPKKVWLMTKATYEFVTYFFERNFNLRGQKRGETIL